MRVKPNGLFRQCFAVIVKVKFVLFFVSLYLNFYSSIFFKKDGSPTFVGMALLFRMSGSRHSHTHIVKNIVTDLFSPKQPDTVASV